MATPSLPSWESLQAAGNQPEISLNMLRIRWKAFGDAGPRLTDLASCVRVAAHARNPPSENDEPFSSLHPISSTALTEPPISSITVRIDDLDTREENWVHEHLPHNWDTSVWEDVYEPEQADDLAVCSIELLDQDQVHGLRQRSSRGRKLVRCCEQKRPLPPAPLVINATDDAKGVTIHNYVVAVHGYLRSHREEILRARRILGWNDNKGTLYVDLSSLDRILLADGTMGGDFPFLSLWSRWASYVDRRLNGGGGNFPSREELLRSKRPAVGGPMSDNFQEAREWFAANSSRQQPQGQHPASSAEGGHLDLFARLDRMNGMDLGEVLRRNR